MAAISTRTDAARPRTETTREKADAVTDVAAKKNEASAARATTPPAPKANAVTVQGARQRVQAESLANQQRMLGQLVAAPSPVAKTGISKGIDSGLARANANAIPADTSAATATSGTSVSADPALQAQLQETFAAQARTLATENPSEFDAIATQAYGDRGAALGAQARAGTLEAPANVRFVDRATLQGSDGAYSPRDGGTVYIADDLRENPAALQAAYAEEASHHLDNALGGADARGDEGEIFSTGLARGERLSPDELETARAQDDVTTVTIDGVEMDVENRWSFSDIFNLATSAASWIPGAGDAVALGSAAVNAATGNYGAALFDIISIVPGVGDAIGTAGKLLLQNRLSRELTGELARGLTRYGPELRAGIQNALNAARRNGIISPAQHRTLSTTLQEQLDLVTTMATRQAGSHADDVARALPPPNVRPWSGIPTNGQARAEAATHGWQEVADSGVASHGQLVFTDGRNFFSPDVDGHIGGTWKIFDRSGVRTGTLDRVLDRIGN